VTGGDEVRRRVLDLYSEATIVGSLRWTGTDNVPGGVVSTVALAERAAQHGFCTEGRVVDVGHSTGSPARFVARRFAATVFGVDINLYETRIARKAAVREGLSRRCVGVLSAAEELPFADGSFDGAWSQDAMCHMDKRRVVAEVGRILRSGAVFAFTDWIDRGGLTADEAAEIDDLLAMPELFDTATYVEVLDSSGFAIRYVEDRTAVVWGSVVAGPDESDWWEEYVARYGDAAQVWRRRIRRWDELVGEGHAGHVAVIAERL
jgi:SAM-dependent methyltransferase